MEELYKGKYSDECIVRKGDILIGMDGDFNCREWNGSDSLLNQRVCKVF
jgi:type I restriction enzyme S subunit